MEPTSHMRVNPLVALRSSKQLIDEKGVNIPKTNDPFNARGLLFDTATTTIFNDYCKKHGRRNVLNNSFRQLWTVFKLCEQYNITLIYYQLLNPMQSVKEMKNHFKRLLNETNDYKLGIDWSVDDTWDMSTAVKTPFFKDLLKNKKHFYGLKYLEPMAKYWSWEIRAAGAHNEHVVAPSIDSEHVKSVLQMNDKDYEMTRDKYGNPIGVDLHPNAKGQKDIAERIWKHYETNFL